MSEQRGSFVEWLTIKQSEPKVITVQRYVCQFCNRSRSTRNAAEQHIARCWRNPAVRGCKTCIHFEVGDNDPPVHHAGNEFCGALLVSLEAGLRTGCEQWEAIS